MKITFERKEMVAINNCTASVTEEAIDIVASMGKDITDSDKIVQEIKSLKDKDLLNGLITIRHNAAETVVEISPKLVVSTVNLSMRRCINAIRFISDVIPVVVRFFRVEKRLINEFEDIVVELQDELGRNK